MDNEIEGEVIEAGAGADVQPDARKAAEHLEDLQRLQAEYVNYRSASSATATSPATVAVTRSSRRCCRCSTTSTLARQHGDLDGGPFASIADKLEAILGRFGVERFGAVGEAFDPAVHEALMHVEADSARTPRRPPSSRCSSRGTAWASGSCARTGRGRRPAVTATRIRER